MRLDVNVLDRDRTPIRGLQQEDFTVLVDGVVQSLVAVSEVEYTGLGARAAATPSDGFVSNQAPATRRAFILVLDDALTPNDPFMVEYTRNAARAFVDGLQPEDLVAVVFSWNAKHNQELTTDRDLVLAAIDQFRSGPGITPGSGIAASRTLQEAINRLHEVPHLRSAILLVGPGIQSRSNSEAQGDPPGIRTISEADLIYGAEMTSALGQAAYARVPIYAISNWGLRAPGHRGARIDNVEVLRWGNDFMRGLADRSGGLAIVDTNDFEPGLRQILLENRHHYVLGYQPNYPVQDGRYRRLEIRVRRATAQVFPSDRFFQAPRPAKRTVATSPRTAIAGILPVSELRLAVRATVGDARSRSGNADVAIELAIGPLENPSGDAALECAAFDAARLTEVGSTKGRASLTDATGTTTARLVLALRRGRYILRCGLHAPALQKAASVYTHVTVPAR